jgi:hypothetical protein
MVVRWLATLVLMAAPALAAGAARNPSIVLLQPWEHGGAQIQLSQVRTLTQRLSKQNLLYQLDLADLHKSDLVRTADELDTALNSLRDGSPSFAVPVPPKEDVREAIEALDEAWGPLRRLAVASPFDYARRERVGSGATGADPLLIRHFAALAQVVDETAADAYQRFVLECERAGAHDCGSGARATGAGPLSERMVKEAVLAFAGFEIEANTTRLRASRERLATVLALAVTLEPVKAAMSPERGKIGDAVGGLWSDIEGHWARLSGEIDLVLAGRREEFSVAETVAVQRLLLHDIQRFSVAVQRFSVGRRSVAAAPR